MEIIRALKFRIYPTEQQQRQIDTTLNCCRYVYNKMLERNSKAYKRRGEHLSYMTMQNLLPQMKKYLPWLKEADSQALKYACRQLDNAFQKLFRKQGGYPHFKSKRKSYQSYHTTNASAIHYTEGKVKLPCLGWIKHSDNRELVGEICHATIERDSGKYYVSITYKYEKDVKPVKPKEGIGLDYKSDGLYMDSDGNCADMPKWFRQSQKAVSKEQRRLSRKQGSRKGEKPSNSFRKQQKRLQKKQRHIANQRKDYLHKKSTEIANQYDFVAVEDLNLKAISRGLYLGKATHDNGYGTFLQMLEYKLEERGKTFVKVGKFYPSTRTCSCCGNIKPVRLDERTYVCPECGSILDRDENAAINIKQEGLRIIGAA